jgi:hypothetical protein
MVQYRFRLAGVSPQEAVKIVNLDVNQNVADVKKKVREAYKLDPEIGIHLTFKGKVLQDNVKLPNLGISPQKDVLTIIMFHLNAEIESFKVDAQRLTCDK